MTEERKQEILKLVDEDQTDDISYEEVKEFFGSLTDEEFEKVDEICTRNRRAREFKFKAEKRRKRDYAHYMRTWNQNEVVRMAKYRETGTHTTMETIQYGKMVHEFILEYMMPKEPVEICIDGFKPFYECPDCAVDIAKYQPFCHNCGRMINWGEEPSLTICEEILREKEVAT